MQFPGNSTETAAGQGQTADEPVIVIPVEAALPERGDISTYFKPTSRVEAESKVEVLARGTGLCENVFVEQGDRVDQGDLLAELDKDEAQASYRQLQVQVKQNEAAYKRAKDAYDQGIGSEVDMDNALFTLEQSRANLEVQRIQLQNLTIKAPIDGIVTERFIQDGMVVTSGNPAFTIVNPDSYILPVAVPEQHIPDLHIGQTARVEIDALPGRTFEARVTRISPAIDESGTVRVVLGFNEEAKELLRDSAFARVNLVMETHEDVLLVPKDAVLEENTRSYLFIVRRADAGKEESSKDVFDVPVDEAAADESGRLLSKEVMASVKDEEPSEPEPGLIAERVEVETGLEDESSVEIVSGLEENEMFVTKGQHTLKPGDHVRVTNITDEIMARAHLTTSEALEASDDGTDTQENDDRGRRGGIHVEMN